MVYRKPPADDALPGFLIAPREDGEPWANRKTPLQMLPPRANSDYSGTPGLCGKPLAGFYSLRFLSVRAVLHRGSNVTADTAIALRSFALRGSTVY